LHSVRVWQVGLKLGLIDFKQSVNIDI